MRLFSRAISLTFAATFLVGSGLSQGLAAKVQTSGAAERKLLEGFIDLCGGIPRFSTSQSDVIVTVGGSRESGRLILITEGDSRTSEDWELPSGNRLAVFSEGQSYDSTSGLAVRASYEYALSAQSVLYPAPWLAQRLSNPDVEILIVTDPPDTGLEANLTHIRIKQSFKSAPKRTHYAEFTNEDLWIDKATGLLRKVQYDRRLSGGSAHRISYAAEFADYQPTEGHLYPREIKRYINGTLWAEIRVSSVSFSTHIPEGTFEIKGEAK